MSYHDHNENINIVLELTPAAGIQKFSQFQNQGKILSIFYFEKNTERYTERESKIENIYYNS